jgi:hypothetical protein
VEGRSSGTHFSASEVQQLGEYKKEETPRQFLYSFQPFERPTFRQVAHLLELSESLPGRIEIVDAAERLDPLLASLGEMIGEGLVTVGPIHILRYLHDPQ